MRPEALKVLEGSDLILHAGDVGKPDVLEPLRDIAPLLVVRGNVDYGDWAQALPMTEVAEADNHLIYMLHIIEELDLDPVKAGFSAVIYGHSHQPSISEKRGVLYINPGSAGRRRFKLPVTVARIDIVHGELRPQIVNLDV